MVTIHSMEYDEAAGIWAVSAVVDLADGTRSGSYQLFAPESATREDLAASVARLYQAG